MKEKSVNIVGTAKVVKNILIQGWFFSKNNVTDPVSFEIYINGKKIANMVANRYREDIVSKKIHPTGKVGFYFDQKINQSDNIYLKFPDFNYTFTIQEGYDIEEKIHKRELCILHIGMHKTGSSSIQYNLSRRSNKGFSYFNLGSANHSIPIYSFFSENPEKYHIHLRAERTADDVNQFNQNVMQLFMQHLMQNKEDEIFIISGEDISFLSMDAVAKLKSFLLHYFKKIKIFAYVRSAESYMSSEFQERVKAGLHDFIPETHWPKYRHRFEKFDLLFGKENVNLIYFNPQNMVNNDVTSDFIYQITKDKISTPFIKINESMTLEAISLLYVFNKYLLLELKMGEKENIRTRLIQFLNKIGNQKVLLNTDILNKVINNHLSDIDWIENRMDMQIAEKTLNHTKGLSNEKNIFNIAKLTLDNLNEKQQKELAEIIKEKDMMKIIKVLNEENEI